MADDAGATGEPVVALHPAPPLRTEDGMRVATDLLDSDVVEIEGDVPEAAEDNADGAAAPPSTDTRSALWRATQLGLAIVVALAVLVGWLGFRANQSDQGQAQRSQFLEAARQTALNLTTIDWQKAESDVQRILDGATGEFHDEFAKQVDRGRHDHRGRAGVGDSRDSPCAGGGEREDVECRCPQTGFACLADAYLRAASRSSGQSLQRGVCAMRWPKSRRADAATDMDSVDETPAGTVQTATVQETNDTEAIAALGESDRDDQPTPSRRRIRWSRMIAYGVLPGLALLLALAAGYLKWQDNSVRDGQVARAESVRAATDGTIALLSYRPDTVQKELEAAQGRLTGTFLDSYKSLTHDVVIPGAKEKQISAVATVPAAASTSATENHAVVLLFVDQTVSVGKDAPTNTASSVRVTLDKVEGRWLISQFDPV
jgi:Mce-associated membrane protein